MFVVGDIVETMNYIYFFVIYSSIYKFGAIYELLLNSYWCIFISHEDINYIKTLIYINHKR